MAAIETKHEPSIEEEKEKRPAAVTQQQEEPRVNADEIYALCEELSPCHKQITFNALSEEERTWLHATTLELILAGYDPGEVQGNPDPSQSCYLYTPPAEHVGIWTTYTFLVREQPGAILKSTFEAREDDEQFLP